MSAANKECFGFFNDSVSCNNCPAVKRCRAILVSDGFDILTALLDAIIEQEVDSGVPFFPKDKASDNIEQLLHREQRESLANDESVIKELFGDEDHTSSIDSAAEKADSDTIDDIMF